MDPQERERYEPATLDEIILQLEAFRATGQDDREWYRDALRVRRWVMWILWNLSWKQREYINDLRELIELMREINDRLCVLEARASRRHWWQRRR